MRLYQMNFKSDQLLDPGCLEDHQLQCLFLTTGYDCVTTRNMYLEKRKRESWLVINTTTTMQNDVRIHVCVKPCRSFG